MISIAAGKSDSEIINWYNYHITNFKKREENFLRSLQPKTQEAFKRLLELTNEDSQNKQIEQDITNIENALSLDMFQEKKNFQEIQSNYAQKILEINKRLSVMGDTSGLENLAKGQFDKISVEAKGELRLVSDNEINKWLNKMLTTIKKITIEDKDPNIASRGITSNLKGAYLEMAVMKELANIIPKDIDVNEDILEGTIDIINTGNVSAKIGTNAKGKAVNRQLPQDIILVYSNEGRETLEKALSEGKTTKKGRTTISVPAYEKITEQTAGISVKAGTSPFKLFEGSLASFFNEGDEDTEAYRENIIARYHGTKMLDNPKGRSVNKFLVAKHLPMAFGQGNMFFATRSNLLTALSRKAEDIRDNKQIYMSYETAKSLYYGRILDK